jgi:hypothetical protein
MLETKEFGVVASKSPLQFNPESFAAGKKRGFCRLLINEF